MISVRDFLIFLSEYKCLGSYWSNVEKSNFVDGYHAEALAFSSIFESSPREWLLRSFKWGYSNEGIIHWHRLNTLWESRCAYLLKQHE